MIGTLVKMIIQFIGLPGSGATEIADAVRDRINGIHLDKESFTNFFAGYNELLYYQKLGLLARLIESKQDKPVIVDGVFNIEQYRKIFGKPDLIIWVDTKSNSYSGAWEDPEYFDHKIVDTGDGHEDALPTRAITIIRKFGLFDWKEDTTLMVDTYQKWNETNFEEYIDSLSTNTQVVVGVKHVSGMTENDLLHFEQVGQAIKKDFPNAKIIKLPNVKSIVHNDRSSFKIEKTGENNE
jgi:hypothetical protein